MRKGHYKRRTKTSSKTFDEFLTITDSEFIAMGREKAYEIIHKVGMLASAGRAKTLKALERRPDLPIPLAYRDTPPKTRKETGETIAPELSYRTAVFVPKKTDNMNTLRSIAKTLRNFLTSKTRTIELWENELSKLNKALKKGIDEKYPDFGYKVEGGIFTKNQIDVLWDLYARITEAKKNDILFSGYDSHQIRQMSAYMVDNYENIGAEELLAELKNKLKLDEDEAILDEDENEDIPIPFNLGASSRFTR